MENSPKIELESALIEKLQGQLTLLQPEAEREAAVMAALEEILSEDPDGLFRQMPELGTAGEKYQAVKNFLSYGIIDDLLCDSDVEDIIINSLKTIYIHHAQKGLIPTGKKFQTHKELDLFVKKLLLLGGRGAQVKKIINLELPNLGGRVNIATSAFGPQLTITKARLEPLSILNLIERGTLTFEVAAQLWVYVEGLSIRPANIIIAGGPGTGKTTLLNALFSFIPESERMVIIEDTLEVNAFLEESCSRLESDDEVSLADLVKNSLRMRPERIVIGEVRGEEAQDMITAANVGKYCISTIHALTCREAILRLQNEPMNIPEVLVNLIDVFVVLKRYHVQDKIFRVIDEVSETSGMEQKTILLSHIFKYDYEQNTIKGVSTSTVFRDRLAQQSALVPKDIIDEVRLRTFILSVLAEKGLTTMKEVTSFCRFYNRDPQAALTSLGFSREKLLKAQK
ncbi:MAG TPA: ATPase, T2SS/T4P/T4SS family [Candidatus Omnitrophota bacterium]|nr:ATPase, T2SS/T4P/T4SS family [Candidatus Omnitrophota bacterium]